MPEKVGAFFGSTEPIDEYAGNSTYSQGKVEDPIFSTQIKHCAHLTYRITLQTADEIFFAIEKQKFLEKEIFYEVEVL